MAIYASTDGGSTWRQTFNLKGRSYRTNRDQHAYEVLFDPSLVFTPLNTAVFAAIDNRRSGDGAVADAARGLGAWFSTDGGLRWQAAKFRDSQGMDDRPFVCADHSLSQKQSSVYITGTGKRPGLFLIYRSIDGGRTYGLPRQIMHDKKGIIELQALNCEVLADGTLAMLFGELKGSAGEPTQVSLKVYRWRPGRQNIDPAVEVNTHPYSRDDSDVELEGLLALDKTSGPYANRLYVTWKDLGSKRARILVSSSDDSGETWSTPRVVDFENDEGTRALLGPISSHPAIGINKNGVVGISWYDRRADPGNLGYAVRFSVSTDGGSTWSRSVLLSSRNDIVDQAGQQIALSSDLFSGKINLSRSATEFVPGHTAGMATDATGQFHPVWIDNRTGTNQVWTSQVAVLDKARDPTTSKLVGLRDISQSLETITRRACFDISKKSITIDIGVRNTGNRPVIGPIRMRLRNLATAMNLARPPSLINGLTRTADGQDGVIELTSGLVDGQLPVGGEAWSVAVQFRVSPPPLAEYVRQNGRVHYYGILDFEPTVFAP